MSTIACDAPAHPTGDTASALDEPAWRAVCETAAAYASKRCALSHDYYVGLFSAAIDGELVRLPETQRSRALQIAREWDYETPAERQESQIWNAEHGFCCHGIQLGYCPAGCDSDY